MFVSFDKRFDFMRKGMTWLWFHSDRTLVGMPQKRAPGDPRISGKSAEQAPLCNIKRPPPHLT